jgi:hypothetical protein
VFKMHGRETVNHLLEIIMNFIPSIYPRFHSISSVRITNRKAPGCVTKASIYSHHCRDEKTPCPFQVGNNFFRSRAFQLFARVWRQSDELSQASAVIAKLPVKVYDVSVYIVDDLKWRLWFC